jgi:hypothetical protein
MDDRVRPGLEHRPAHGRTIEQVKRDRLSAERPYLFRFLSRRRAADHLVALLDKLGHEPCADRTARPCYENTHCGLLWSRCPDFAGLPV